jgi:membrane protease YdiL (CAAX protease family)
MEQDTGTERGDEVEQGMGAEIMGAEIMGAEIMGAEIMGTEVMGTEVRDTAGADVALPFPDRVPRLSLVVFLVIAFGLAWLITLPLWLSGTGLATPGAGLLVILMMYSPAAAALVTILVVQRPRPRPLAEYLGLWPLRPAKRVVWLTVVGWLGVMLLVGVGVFLAAALGLVRLDLVHFSGFAAALAVATGGAHLPLPIGALVFAQLISLPIGSVINSLATIGEELGWRGWLLPSLRPLGTWPALLISGAIWGLWHAPVILLGYDFGEPNALGVLMMVGACTLLGTLFGWLRLRSGSVWPSVFAHAGLNAVGGLLTLLAAAGTTPNLVVVGPLGLVTWIVMAAVIAGLAVAGQFRPQPRLRSAAKV